MDARLERQRVFVRKDLYLPPGDLLGHHVICTGSDPCERPSKLSSEALLVSDASPIIWKKKLLSGAFDTIPWKHLKSIAWDLKFLYEKSKNVTQTNTYKPMPIFEQTY